MYSSNSKRTWWKEVERDLIDDPCSWIRPKPVPKSDVCATIAAQPTGPKTHLKIVKAIYSHWFGICFSDKAKKNVT